jgi:hypothetical protein
MEDIFDTNSQFPFDKISLNTPTSMSGGVYFSKIFINKKQLYIQSPKCKTKQGIVKSGKKIHTDLVFSNDDEEFIQWIESLESTVRKHIYINRAKWFDMDLDEDDIENYFTPTVKLFKSGKQNIMRVNISQRIGSVPLKIYDENEIDVDMDSIQENTPLITILEVQGVRCSSKSFQIDIELKQIMVMKSVNLFERCIIKSSSKIIPQEKSLVKTEEPAPLEPVFQEPVFQEPAPLEPVFQEPVSEPVFQEPVFQEPVFQEPVSEPVFQEPVSEPDNYFNDYDILEVNLDIDEIENNNIFHLKEKTEVYYQMYREARQKAKLAKSLALSSYLEARRIKNLYMLDNIDDSDESDLEDLEN